MPLPENASKAPERDLSDYDLVESFRSGDASAFALLCQRHRDAATRFAESLVDDKEVAATLTDEAIVRVTSALQVGKPEAEEPPEPEGRKDVEPEATELDSEAGEAAATSVAKPESLETEAETGVAAPKTEEPTVAVRPLILKTVLAVVLERAKSDDNLKLRTETIDRDHDQQKTIDDAANNPSSRTIAALPGTMQEILWRLDVEHESIGDVAASLGLSKRETTKQLGQARRDLSTGLVSAEMGDITPPYENFPNELVDWMAGSASHQVSARVRESLEQSPRLESVALTIQDNEKRLHDIMWTTLVGCPPVPSYAKNPGQMVGRSIGTLSKAGMSFVSRKFPLVIGMASLLVCGLVIPTAASVIMSQDNEPVETTVAKPSEKTTEAEVVREDTEKTPSRGAALDTVVSSELSEPTEEPTEEPEPTQTPEPSNTPAPGGAAPPAQPVDPGPANPPTNPQLPPQVPPNDFVVAVRGNAGTAFDPLRFAGSGFTFVGVTIDSRNLITISCSGSRCEARATPYALSINYEGSARARYNVTDAYGRPATGIITVQIYR